MADVTRNANVHWEGDVRRGSGNIDSASSGAGRGLPFSLPTRSSDDASGQTSPEELIAASHAGLARVPRSARLSPWSSSEPCSPEPSSASARSPGAAVTVLGLVS